MRLLLLWPVLGTVTNGSEVWGHLGTRECQESRENLLPKLCGVLPGDLWRRK